MRVSEEPDCIYLFRNLQFFSLHFRSPVHAVTPQPPADSAERIPDKVLFLSEKMCLYYSIWLVLKAPPSVTYKLSDVENLRSMSSHERSHTKLTMVCVHVRTQHVTHFTYLEVCMCAEHGAHT